jgi:ElaB/YqjD/DUF883 family membrane-anchored ribosome-binding protein
MSTVGGVFDELRKIISQVEDLIQTTLGGAGEQAGEVADRLHEGIGQARERLADFEQGLGRDLKQGAQAADRYVRDNAWVAIGAAAAAAFLIGVLVSRRD